MCPTNDMNALRKTSGKRDNNLVVKLQRNSKEQFASQSPGTIINGSNMIGRHVSVGKENKSLSWLISHKLTLFFNDMRARRILFTSQNNAL